MVPLKIERMQVFGIGGTIAKQIKISQHSVLETDVGIESNGRQSAKSKTGFHMLDAIGGKAIDN
jgi:hypothetical protein